MEMRYFSIRLQEKLLNEKWILEKGMFIKKRTAKCSLGALHLIDENQHKLTDDYFAYLTHQYVGRNGEVEAVGGKFYSEYVNFGDLYSDISINKPQVIKECIEAVLELQNIGVNYIDIHSNDIIVNKESHMKLVDLDESELLSICDNDKTIFIINLMLESMLFYEVRNSIFSWLSPKSVLLELENKKVLSSKFLDTIAGKNDFTSFYSNADKYLEELCDKEKAYVLRKELRDKYPKWF